MCEVRKPLPVNFFPKVMEKRFTIFAVLPQNYRLGVTPTLPKWHYNLHNYGPFQNQSHNTSHGLTILQHLVLCILEVLNYEPLGNNIFFVFISAKQMYRDLF